MKKRTKGLLTAFVSALLSFAVMLTAAYVYMSADRAKKSVGSTESRVPYKQKQESKGVMFLLPDGTGCLFHLDFENESVTAVLTETADPYADDLGGYGIDFTVELSFDTAEGIIDRAGGVNLEEDGQMLRFTGFQVIQLISQGAGMDLRREIVCEVLSGFAKNSITAGDLVYIIENSQTDLTVPECYGWHQDLPQMFENATVFFLT